ncbi:MAG: creatininase family protein [Chitinispirillia bacterium]|jgi:creatinine amidohydrolase/Fe(II)-dependent formamide hydrolase-like protein
MKISNEKSSLYLPFLTSKEIEKAIETIPAIFQPVGSYEPIGLDTPICLIQDCTESMASVIAEKCNILQAPILPFSYSIPYRAFPGGLGLKSSVIESSITNLIKEYSYWGIKNIFIFDGSYDSFTILERAVKRFKKHRKNITVILFNWQDENIFNSTYKLKFDGEELGRKEYGLLSMAAYLHPFTVSKVIINKKKSFCDLNVYKRWKKCGHDPEKFRKLFPDCSTSNFNIPIDKKTGKKLFEDITDYYEKKILSIIR